MRANGTHSVSESGYLWGRGKGVSLGRAQSPWLSLEYLLFFNWMVNSRRVTHDIISYTL